MYVLPSPGEPTDVPDGCHTSSRRGQGSPLFFSHRFPTIEVSVQCRTVAKVLNRRQRLSCYFIQPSQRPFFPAYTCAHIGSCCLFEPAGKHRRRGFIDSAPFELQCLSWR